LTAARRPGTGAAFGVAVHLAGRLEKMSDTWVSPWPVGARLGDDRAPNLPEREGIVIVVFGGVQIDGPGRFPSRFTQSAVAEVFDRTCAVLDKLRPRLVLGAAASGADLTVLRAAWRIGLARLVVLPFSVDRFRETSVASRGSRWVDTYDDTLASLRDGELEILDETEDDAVYQRTNTRLLERAGELSGSDEEIKLLVLRPAIETRGDHPSVTDDLVDQATHRGMEVVEVATNPERRPFIDYRIAARGDGRWIGRPAAAHA
jgi:hypothetical protein